MATLDVIANAAARPGSPSDGDMYYQSDLQQVILYDGTATAWKIFTPDESPYALDGSNTTTVRPAFHFDASMLNGEDATGQLDNLDLLDIHWYSRTNDMAADISAAASQPKYYASGTNSKPYFLIADAADHLYCKGALDKLRFTGDLTMMLVANRATNDTTGVMSMPLETSANVKIWFSFSSGNDWMYGTTHGNLDRPSINLNDSGGGSAEMTYATTRLFMITRASGVTDLWVDGNNQNSSLGTSNSTTLDAFDLVGGGGSYDAADMHLYEYAVWPSNLSNTDKNTIISYVNAKYGSGKGHDGSENLARATF